MNGKITIGTSIAPINIEDQIFCIQSWLDNGFDVISCNTSEEIEIIKPLCSGMKIEFVEITCELNAIRDKKLPYIHDILMCVWKKTKSIGGFANSDIYLDNITNDLYEFIYKEASKSLLFVRRNEVNNIENIEQLDWKMHFDGIDMFLIDKQFIPSFFDEGFFVQSCWDNFILLKARMQGIQVKELMNPIAFHKKHVQKWSFKTSNILAEKFWLKYFDNKENAFARAMQSFYDILLNECRQVCFLNERLKCLFVINKKSWILKQYIEKQDSLGLTITVEENDNNREKYDYIFYLVKDIKLSPVFCKSVIYTMMRFGCKKLQLGEFYITKINGERHYSNLNKSIELLEYIHEQCEASILVEAQNLVGESRYMAYPIAYKEMDINDSETFRKQTLQGTYYIIPAGIRANRWYEENKGNLCNLKFLGFLDNYKKGYLEQNSILPIEILKRDQEAYVIVASKYYIEEIMKQVQTLTEKNRVINAGFIDFIDSDGTIYYFDINRYKRKYEAIGIKAQGDNSER